MKSLLAIIAICITLSGCASTYSYDGDRYPNKDAFNAGVEMKLSQATAAVSPLPSPVSKKTLVFSIPSEQAIVKQSISNFYRLNGRTIGLGEELILRPVMTSNYKGLKALHDIIVRKNIYPNVRYVELDAMTSDLQPTATEDVLFYSESHPGAGQWYYATVKTGKQAFAYDRGGVDMAARSKAFAEAIQVYAIRE